MRNYDDLPNQLVELCGEVLTEQKAIFPFVATRRILGEINGTIVVNSMRRRVIWIVISDNFVRTLIVL